MSEERRIQDGDRWRAWGPYLPDRQWGTVREDYSEHGDPWGYFPHDHARSRAYRWGEDGLFGWCDEEARLCFSIALWNGHDGILKERLFGLSSPEGNHGESVKEVYFHQDGLPSHAYQRALYRYPQRAFPYGELVHEGLSRSADEPEYGLIDTGAFNEDRFFDVTIEYAKAAHDDTLIRVTIENRGPETAEIVVAPTLWFRNTWSWDASARPSIKPVGKLALIADHHELQRYRLDLEEAGSFLVTDNDTNARVWGGPNEDGKKDAFHRVIVDGVESAARREGAGTKVAVVHRRTLAPGERMTLRLRLRAATGKMPTAAFGDAFEETFATRVREADAYYAQKLSGNAEERFIARRAAAGLSWSKQRYEYDVTAWLDGDPAQPAPPAARLRGRNHTFRGRRVAAVLAMPDRWEYPWFAAWDLAFHAVAMAPVDPTFAQAQLLALFAPRAFEDGQLLAQEFSLGDDNPPVHAWAALQTHRFARRDGANDNAFLEEILPHLLAHFRSWCARLDPRGEGLACAGFLGLDNVGPFDRGAPPPFGARLIEADATAWTAFFATSLLAIAITLGRDELACEMLEKAVFVGQALNSDRGLWSEEHAYYFDAVQHHDGARTPIACRSIVGIVPLFATLFVDGAALTRLPLLNARMQALDVEAHGDGRLVAIVPLERRNKLLSALLDEEELLGPFGVRSLSRRHLDAPLVLATPRGELRVDYTPGESRSKHYGLNSNWRGPVWLPINALVIHALTELGRASQEPIVRLPPSAFPATATEAATLIASRVVRLFMADAEGRRPAHGDDPSVLRDQLLFPEYFHGDTGRGLGASHQTGWTALVIPFLADLTTKA
jgi:hypothetical protein